MRVAPDCLEGRPKLTAESFTCTVPSASNQDAEAVDEQRSVQID